MKKIFIYCCMVLSCFCISCGEDFNIFFSIDDEKALGLQVSEEIAADPTEYPILPRSGNEKAYQYVEDIMNAILNSNEVNHKDDFDWELTLINTPTLNAFAAPGGKLFFYTGFLKYATSEAELAGVMAHEIAHSDKRHSTESMAKEMGIAALLGIVAGENAGALAQLASQIAQTGMALKFSRAHEYEADEYSVRYLNSIRSYKEYDPIAILDFFDRMNEENLSEEDGKFEFLRTHPYDANRKENVHKIWQKLGSPTGQKFSAEYAQFKALLP
ncbi:MAG: M48 family metallopeptidase [Bacteroidales bacterium]|jgi:predicted Zn-dependent protease|nr:M48 family metallopeptidase [Bacteroidales bacterium]